MTTGIILFVVITVVAVVAIAILIGKKKPSRDLRGEVKQAINSMQSAEPRPDSGVSAPTIGGTRIYSAKKEPTIRFNCPFCGQHFDAPRGMIGDNIKCAACTTEFIVPESAATNDTEE
jgi:hypothetical protein